MNGNDRSTVAPDPDAREQRVRRYFREHHAGIEPDAGFASRVTAGLRGDPADLLGWAAMRLLPATFALAALLAWFSFQAVPAPMGDTVAEVSSSDDLIGWVLEDSGTSP